MCQAREDAWDRRGAKAGGVQSHPKRSPLQITRAGIFFLLLSATPFDGRVDELSRDYNVVAQEALRFQERSETLQRELFEAQIAQSSFRVRKLEEEMRLVWRNPILYRQIIQGRLPLLFERDRATLKLIIRETPELAPNAQAVLDQIAILAGYIAAQPSPCPLRNIPPDLPQNPSVPCK